MLSLREQFNNKLIAKMTKKLPPEVKMARKPTRIACSFCHSKHLQCDSTRPCKNCVKRNIGDSCTDVVRRKLKERAPRPAKKKEGPAYNGSDDVGNVNVGVFIQAPNVIPAGLKTKTSTSTIPPLHNNIINNSNKENTNVPQVILKNPLGDSTDSKSLLLTNPQSIGPIINNPGNPIKKKRGRPPKNKKLSNDPNQQTVGTINKRRCKSKEDQALEVEVNKDDKTSTEMSGLGLIEPSSLGFLPPIPSTSNPTNDINAKTNHIGNNGHDNGNYNNNNDNSHLPLINLANVSLSNLNLNQINPLPSSNSLSNLRLPSFSDLKNQGQLFNGLGLQDIKTPQATFSPKFSSLNLNLNLTPTTSTNNTLAMMGLPSISSTGLHNLLNNQSNSEISKDHIPEHENVHADSLKPKTKLNLQLNSDASKLINTDAPETPGSPLEFSVSNTSRTNTSTNNSHKNDHENELVSSNSSIKNFQSTNLNEEHDQLTGLLASNPLTPNMMYLSTNSQHEANEQMNHFSKKFNKTIDYTFNNDDEVFYDIDDDDIDTRPYISINLEDNTMVSSYPNNSTPNSYAYNADHSQILNTANQIPKDLEQNDDYTSPLIMRHVIKQPDDIYLTNTVKAYQYPKAYHALIAYLKKRFNKRQLLEIAKCMAKYRPSFISATKNLYENDLIFTERSLQRTLLEYENLISISPSPTIIWRRTGEIVALTNEFAVMTGYSKMSLLTKRTFIVELMDDESTINYFKSFSEFAFGDLNATYLTDCNLRKAENNNYLRCCCVWTIKRDVFDIPMLIVGQFLPVLE